MDFESLGVGEGMVEETWWAKPWGEVANLGGKPRGEGMSPGWVSYGEQATWAKPQRGSMVRGHV
jgi:hypothetical protein